TTVEVGDTVAPLVRAIDDFAVKSVTLTVDGVTSAPATSAPYKFSWVPNGKQAGRTVKISATVTDASGKVTKTDDLTVKVAKVKGQPPVTGPSEPTPVVPKPTLKISKVVKKPNGTAVIIAKVNGAGTVKLTGGKVRSSVR